MKTDSTIIKKLVTLWNRTEDKDSPEEYSHERREFIRFEYPSADRPKLKIREYEMDIINISERGIKFIKDPDIKIGHYIHGTILFKHNKALDVTGKIMWQKTNMVGLLSVSIPGFVIIKEIRALLGKKGIKESEL